MEPKRRCSALSTRWLSNAENSYYSDFSFMRRISMTWAPKNASPPAYMFTFSVNRSSHLLGKQLFLSHRSKNTHNSREKWNDRNSIMSGWRCHLTVYVYTHLTRKVMQSTQISLSSCLCLSRTLVSATICTTQNNAIFRRIRDFLGIDLDAL